MSTHDRLLASADPALDLPALSTDSNSSAAVTLLGRITADDRRPTRRPARTRRIGWGAGAAAAAALIVTIVAPWHGRGPSAPGAYAVTPGDGSVRVVVRWTELADPAALQQALDRAGAHVKIFVTSDSEAPCPVPTNTTPYSSGSVRWTSRGNDSGFVVRPGSFPANGTFVVSVRLAAAGSTGSSTFSPGAPQLEGINSFMVVGAVPTCGP